MGLNHLASQRLQLAAYGMHNMREILGITNYPKQKRAVVLEDGTQFEFEMDFSSLQFGWFIRNFTYGDFELNGLRITNQPNMLFQFKNQLPFGLACSSKEDREPSLIDDFSSGNSRLYVLSESEVQDYEDFLNGL